MASREQNEAVAGLLRQSLAKDAAGQSCPDSELLAAYFEHSLAEGEVSNLDLHLSTCSRCRAQLAAMVRAELPKSQPKTFWLLDWRLLTATALVMVIATVLLLRRPTELAPVAQSVNSPVARPVAAPNADSSSAPKLESGATNHVASPAAETKKKSVGRLRLAVPPSNSVPQSDDGKVATNDGSRGATKPTANSDSFSASNSVSVQTESADLATPQPARVAGQGGGLGLKQNAPSAGAAPAPEQIPPSSQMVVVQPGPPPRPAATSPVAKESKAAAREQDGAPPTVATTREPAGLSKNAQSETIPNAEQPTDKVIKAYAVNEAAVQVQTLEERTKETVIDTPIPTIKWRIAAAGFVERSEDGGATWTGQEPDPAAHLIAGSAPSDKICWLVGKEGVVLVTKDAINWKKIPPPANADITAISAKNASDATVTTGDGRRFTTHNQGKKWKSAK